MEPENKYQIIFESSPLGIIYLDENEIISLCNEKIATILGMQKNEIIGASVTDIFTSGNIQEIIESACAGKKTHSQYDYHPLNSKNNDKIINIEIHCSPAISEQVSTHGRVLILEDVTSKVKLKNTLKLDESRLEALLKLYHMSNMSIKEIANFVQEEAVKLTQSKLGYLAFLDEEDMLVMHSWSHSAMEICAVINRTFEYPLETTGIWGEAIRQRKPIITNDFQAPNPLKKGYPEGHVEIYRHMNIPIFDGDEIVGVAGVGNKESDYNKSDIRQMQLLMEGMWHLIQRKKANDALKEYAEELKKANEMKDTFTDILRHDLLNPAGVVKGYANILLDTETDEKRLEYLRNLEESNNKLIDIIESASSFAKIENMEGLELEKMDIVPMLKLMVQNFRFQITEKQMIVVNKVSDTEYMARINPVIEEVFVNLFSNAIKYSPASERIIIDIVDNDSEWKVTFTDFGNGVNNADKSKLFNRFKRADKTGIRGTGLGLAIAKKITELHGGSIGVEDNPAGKGSVFWATVKKA